MVWFIEVNSTNLYNFFSRILCVDDCSLQNYFFFTVLTDGVLIHTVSKL